MGSINPFWNPIFGIFYIGQHFISIELMALVKVSRPYSIGPSPTCSWCYKTFFEGNLDFPKIKKWNTCTKCENSASFKQIDALKLLIAFKMAHYCFLSFGGNLDFPEFLQKKFYYINYWYQDLDLLPRSTLPRRSVPDLRSP